MDGFINLNKPSGPSSQWAVSQIKRLLHVKAGHCGTLDPMAQGVLPLCLGKATRLSEYVMGRGKTYLAGLVFGIVTDSYDAAGQVLAEKDASSLTQAQIEALLPSFVGRVMQRPPAVSALKQGGVPLYKRVLRGEEVQVAARPVQFYRVELVDFQPGPRAHCRLLVECGQGAYIRSLAHDLGQALGCGAHLDFLQRSQVGAFRLEESYTVEQVAEMAAAEDFSFLIPMEQALSHLPGWTCREADLTAIAHGNDLPWSGPETPAGDLTVRTPQGKLAAVGHVTAESTLVLDKVLLEVEAFQQPRRYGVYAIGNFDGLHLGHRALLRRAYRRKRELGTKSALVTFSPHPLTLITGTPPPLLLSERLKRELAREHLGMDGVIALPFTPELMHSTPEAFVDRVLVEQLQAKEVVVGYNFTFGDRGAGKAETLVQLCAARGLRVTVIDEVRGPYGSVSASNIRRRLLEGDLTAANAMLGYWFTLDGTVKNGGFPIDPQQVRPPAGWYAARLSLKRESRPAAVRLTADRLLLPRDSALEERRVLVHFGLCLGTDLTPEEAEAQAAAWLAAQPEGVEWR